jgi:indole-3-glycerol phosphate synthase
MILDKIVESTKNRVEGLKRLCPPEEMKKRAEELPVSKSFLFEKALKKEELALICEVKKASPSKGIIAAEFPYVDIAIDYEDAGADCISVLTEPEYFLGSNRYLEEISRQVNIPLLRKDFIVDSYQIYEARLMGASAVLLISSILAEEQIGHFIDLADQLGLSALVESHNKEEVRKSLRAGARILGINNRNLKNFEVDFSNCMKLRGMVPPEVIFVSESGIKNAEHIAQLKKNGVDAVLVGEALMVSNDKKTLLKEWRRV